MNELGIGIVGFGFIGRVHALGYASLPFYYSPAPCRPKLVGVCTSRPETARKAAEEIGFEFATTDYRELLARDDIQLVDCCTPNDMHLEVVAAAARAGKHVYCEKPLAMNAEQAHRLVAAVGQAGVKNQVALQYRFIPAVMRAKQLLDEGRLGRLFSVRACYLHAGYINPRRPLSWRMKKDAGGGGALLDLGSHVLDLVLHLAGEFDRVFALAPTFITHRPVAPGAEETGPVEVDDAVYLMLQRDDPQTVATVEATRVATGAQDEIRLEFHGDRGALAFNSMEPNWLRLYDVSDPGEPLGGERGFKAIECVQRYPKPNVLPGDKFAIGWIRYHFAAIYELLAALVEDRPCSPSFAEAAGLQELMDCVYRSAGEERWVTLRGDAEPGRFIPPAES